MGFGKSWSVPCFPRCPPRLTAQDSTTTQPGFFPLVTDALPSLLDQESVCVGLGSCLGACSGDRQGISRSHRQ